MLYNTNSLWSAPARNYKTKTKRKHKKREVKVGRGSKEETKEGKKEGMKEDSDGAEGWPPQNMPL